jgi:hypothetical protein
MCLWVVVRCPFVVLLIVVWCCVCVRCFVYVRVVVCDRVILICVCVEFDVCD